MLTEIAELFGGDVSAHWADTITRWGEWIDLYRKYTRGEHNVYLTGTMRRMLNVDGAKFATFSADYTDMVVRMMADRMIVEQIEAIGVDSPAEGADDPAQVWVDRLLKKNRFDELQMDIHEATVRDGDAFVIVEYDDEGQCARLNFNEAYNGDVGVIPIYSLRDPRRMMAAAKVFYVDREQKQVNVYYADRIERFVTSEAGTGLTATGSDEWLAGMPVIHFSNRRRSGENVGVSELQKAISLQDILNRILVSMVMASELSAFQVLFAKGFDPPSAVTPGSIITALSNSPELLAQADLKAIPQGQLTEFIEEINKIIDLIAEVTQTPIASVLGTNPSGEALKQREVGLLSKVRGAHVKVGNSWEDVMMVAHRVETVYKAVDKPPMIEMFDCKWRDASVRADKDVIEQAGMVYDKLQSDELYVEMVAEVEGWSADKQREILDAIQARANATFATTNLFGNVGEFSNTLNGVPEVA